MAFLTADTLVEADVIRTLRVVRTDTGDFHTLVNICGTEQLHKLCNMHSHNERGHTHTHTFLLGALMNVTLSLSTSILAV